TPMKSDAVSTCEICGGRWYIPQPPSDEYPMGSVRQCQCVQLQQRRQRLAELMKISGLTAEAVRAWSFETFHPEQALADPAAQRHLSDVMVACQAFARAPRGWLMLSGPYGSGKSHLAYATAGAYLRAGHAVYISTVPDLLEALRRGFNHKGVDSYERRFDTVCRAELLVLDDLGAQSDSPWATEKLYQIIDFRYRLRLPLMVTTNVNHFAPGGRLEPRLLSRLLDGAHLPDGFSRVHLLAVGDYRQRTPRRE
ncbi:MAG: ATP-binding protein, partial [Anaerolineae bacterium]